MKKIRKIGIILVLTLVILAFAVQSVNAQTKKDEGNAGGSLLDCLSNPPACAIFYLSYFVNIILGLLIALAVFLVQIALTFNFGVIKSPTVTTGFDITLSIANLGFVLALIVIALATILRRESYGVKSLLWKLVLAAVLVNFSLVIAGQVLALSDSFTNYFIKPFGDPLGFANQLSGTFKPQILNAPKGSVGCTSLLALDPLAGTACFALKTYNFATKGDFDPSFFKEITKAVLHGTFTAVAAFIIMFTLFALAILLLIRYVYISILLILAPLAWLAWVFPGLGNHFSKWWHDFIKWSFFPAIMTFFLYLVIVIAGQKDKAYLGSNIGKSLNTDRSAAVGIALGGGDTDNGGLFATFAQQVVLTSLALGGLFAANQMSIKGADVAMKGLKGVGNATKGYLGKQAGRAKSYGLRTETGRKVTGGLQTAGMGPNTHPVIRALLRPAREAGTFLAKRRESTEGLVKKKQSELGKYSYEEQAKRFGSEDNPGRLAIMENLKRAEKKGDLNAKAAFDSLPQNAKDRLDRLRTLYGRGKGEHFESGAGAATAMDKMEEEVKKREEAGEKVDDIKGALGDLKAAEEKKKDAEDKQNKGDDSEKTISTIKDEGEKSRRALESIKEAVEKRKAEGKDIEVFQNAIDEFELAQRETEGKKEKGGGKGAKEGPVIKIFGENIGEGPIETIRFDDQGKPKA